jgi:hypothetical protein
MGLGSSASCLAAAGYSLSGSVVLWLGFSLSHVTPCLPWLLFGIELLRSGQRLVAGWVTTSVALTLAIYGGHPEVAFFTGLCGGLWCSRLLSTDARRLRLAFGAMLAGVLCGAPVLVPFIEYLANSGALVAHKLAPSQRVLPDWVTLGVPLLFLSFLRGWKNRTGQRSSRPIEAVEHTLMGAMFFTLLASLSFWGAEFETGLDRLISIESGSSWIAFPISALAFSAMLTSPAEIGARRTLWLLGPLSLALATSVPGIVDLWRWIPLVGLAAPARAACVAALCVSLLAGHGMESGKRSAHLVVLIGLGLATAVFLYFNGTYPAEARTEIDRTRDPIVVYDELPSAESKGGSGTLRGTIHGGLQADAVRMKFEELDEDGDEVVTVSDFVHYSRLTDGAARGDIEFDFGELDLSGLGPGRWRLRVEFLRGGEVIGKRQPCILTYPKSGGLDKWGIGFACLSLLGLLFVGKRPVRNLMIALTCGQGLLLAHRWNPTVPLDAHLTETATERFLTKNYPGERFVADPGIFPGDTALLSGLTTIGGYDALDVASFDGFRMYALKAGRNPLLHWNTDGFDLQGPGFRLFGVGLLLSHTRIKIPGWRLVAGPEHAPAEAELFVYECEDELRRAYCVSNVVTVSEVLADPSAFDPTKTAFLQDSFSIAFDKPFVGSRVEELVREPERLEFRVELDGEGLFVSSEQHFPGWKLWVDGTETPILRVNSIFRGVALGPGSHELLFEYQPKSWSRGLLLGGVGLLVFLLGLFAARTRLES